MKEIMNDYCQVIIDVIKKRNIVEESVKFKKFEDTGEIIAIDFTYLNETQMEEIIKMLYYETNLNKDLIKEMGGLKTSKFPMEFYYKIFLFWDSFLWNFIIKFSCFGIRSWKEKSTRNSYRFSIVLLVTIIYIRQILIRIFLSC